MRKAELAELILSLATSQDRAATIVGDLLEQDDWFWISVLRTAVAQMWLQFRTAPLALAGIAIRGMFAEFGFLLLACLTLLLLLWIAVSVLLVSFHSRLPAPVTPWLAYFLSNLVVPFQLGRWIARRYPGKEAAASVTLSTMHAVVNVCAGLICWEIVRHGGTANITASFSGIHFIAWDANLPGMLAVAVSYLTLYQMLLLGGAAFARAKSAQ